MGRSTKAGSQSEPVSEQLAQMLILMSQHTPFRGSSNYAGLERAAPTSRTTLTLASRFPQAETELSLLDSFFDFFTTPATRQLLRGKMVLDLGCGYGGRTVGYATETAAAEVIGVEVYPNVIVRCQEYAAAKGVHTCRFLLATQQQVPLPDASVDVVVSYDVLEHVEDPPATMREVHRVLKPGG